MLKKYCAGLLALATVLFVSSTVSAGDKYITVASTTSTANSGMFDYLLPKFTAKTGVEVRVVAVGTGAAIRLARGGDADILFVHHRPSEEKFVAEGFGIKRYDVMYNDFVIVGPSADKAGIKECKSGAEAFKKIGGSKAAFASRGDDSGTHKREKSIWKAAGVETSGSWYRSTGSGMGATLNTASAMGAYALSDRGTWISFKNKGELQILCAGDPNLFNPYGVILVNKVKFPHVKAKMGQQFIDWIVGTEGQKSIGDFRLEGKTLFSPNAK
ncbi:MAG: substrate-binding domain-containing protein [Rhodospirillales bacterium]|nr:substrate-binding domain-containing protein [Rhodospirillales bacterium]